MISELIKRGDTLFREKSSLNSLWQEIADNFYPERADFTTSRYLGRDFASNLQSSYPVIVRRELGNAFSSVLRPSELEWFQVTVDEDEHLSKASKVWLEHATTAQRRAMYDRQTQFVRATKEADHDFSAFGQCVISTEFHPINESLLYRTWHLRDCAWAESNDGSIGELHINWKPRARELKSWYGDKCHRTVLEAAEREPEKRIPCRRVVISSDEYRVTDKRFPHPWVHVMVDCENQCVMSEIPVPTFGYTIPRWQTVSGSQYAYSPATVAGLPDARLLQAMTLTLLEAGEMAVHPPYLASADVIREDIQNFAGGITWISSEYDKRMHDVLRPLNQDKSGLPFGMDFAAEIRQMLGAAFYLNKLTLPAADRDMTAYETAERIKEYVRSARPLFEPAEYEYNHGLCDETFQTLLRRGAFGSVLEMPEELQGRNVRFKFESPLHTAVERQKAVAFLEATQIWAAAQQVDPSSGAVLDARTALRQALEGISVPSEWMRTEDEVEQLATQAAAAQQMQQNIQMLGEGATAAEQLQRAAQPLV